MVADTPVPTVSRRSGSLSVESLPPPPLWTSALDVPMAVLTFPVASSDSSPLKAPASSTVNGTSSTVVPPIPARTPPRPPRLPPNPLLPPPVPRRKSRRLPLHLPPPHHPALRPLVPHRALNNRARPPHPQAPSTTALVPPATWLFLLASPFQIMPLTTSWQ